MTLRVALGAADLVCDLTGRFLLLVTGADDPDAALSGLDAARARLAELGPALVSPAVHSPDGPLLRVTELAGDDDVLQQVPDLVAEVVALAGVSHGTIEVRETGSSIDRIDLAPDCVVLRAFPEPAESGGTLPVAWLEVAAEWVLGDLAPDDEVQLRLLGAGFTVRAADAPAWLHGAAAARTWCDLVQGDPAQRLRTASLTFGHAPHLSLAAGGPGCNVSALLARFDLLCEVAKELTQDLAYACVDLEPTFELIGAGLTGEGWPAQGGAPPNAVAGLVGDVVVPDAFPYQLLGAGHLDRLAQRGRADGFGHPLDDGRVELWLGEPVDWLPRYETRQDWLDQGSKELADLLVDEAELAELVRLRPLRAAGLLPAAAGGRGGPELDDVVLDPLPHVRRGLHITLLELAAWIGHEPHSDAPTGVSPVLATYARWLASGRDDVRRQALKPYAARLTGTRGTGLHRGAWRPLDAADELRVWLAVDWLARVQVPAWLRTAGLPRPAATIEKVRVRAGQRHVPRLLAVLESALDLVVARVRDTEVDERAWDAWESASEATGWVAASEAAWVGVPVGLASAAELHVIEAARGGRPGPTGVVDEARAAAHAAVAEAAWRSAGRAAAHAVDASMAEPDDGAAALSVSLSVALERAAQGAAARLDIDRDVVDQQLEEAEAAGRSCLATMVAFGDPRPGALDAAREVAAASSGGAAWTAVQELTEGVLGDAAWEAGHAAARTAAQRVLHHASPLVDRAVLVALAREVGGLAARLAATEQATEALEPAVHELRDRATELLDALIAPT